MTRDNTTKGYKGAYLLVGTVSLSGLKNLRHGHSVKSYDIVCKIMRHM